MNIRLPLLCSLFIAALLVSCDDDAPEDTSLFESSSIDVSSPSFGVINILRATGNEVEVLGDTSRPFFSPPAHVIAVNGSVVQLYEYDSKEDLEEEASTISSDGSTLGSTHVAWEMPPHFYKSDKVIVLYEGDDSTMKRTLTDAIGPQFAGRE